MRVVISMVDKYIIVDGEARPVQLNGLAEEGVRGISWDGETGHRWYDFLSRRDPEFFTDEAVILPYIELWRSAPPPEPPPLPPWEDEPELPLPLPRNAIPTVIVEAFDGSLPAWDDPPPEGQEKMPPTSEPELPLEARE